MVKNNADVNVQDEQGRCPLHLACLDGLLECFQVLIDYGYKALDCVDKKGKTPLDYAKENNHDCLYQYARQISDLLFCNKGSLKHKKSIKTKDFKRLGLLG